MNRDHRWKTLAVVFMAGCAIFATWSITRSWMAIQFDRNCGGYLARAANANTVELAKEQLTTALGYIERHGLTNGYTSIIWTTPDEDVGYWHTNLRESLKELEAIPVASTGLERSNLLLKLRESLTDHGDDGTKVVMPRGISVCPFNTIFAWWGWIATLITLGPIVVFMFTD